MIPSQPKETPMVGPSSGQRPPLVHAAPHAGPSALTDPMPCCGRTPFAVVQECQDDELTLDPAQVTCPGA